MMPDERASNLNDLKFLAIQFTKNPRLPVVGDLRQLFSEIHFIHRIFSFSTSVHCDPDLLLARPLFVLKQPALALDSATIAGERSVRADHAMARDYDPNRICAIGKPNGTNCGRTANSFSKLRIGDCRATANLAQRMPHLPLKRRAAGFNR